MEIATNAVFAAMLIQASQFARDIELPLQTPLERSNVVVFRTYVSWSQADSDLHAYLAYKGGYEFRFAHGCIDGFNTRDSYTDLQRPAELVLLSGEVKHTQDACFAKVRKAFSNLGYSNVSLLNTAPEVKGPITVQGGVVPRFIFRWPEPGDPQFPEAQVEVNANRLTIEHLSLVSKAFWRNSWPITFGTTNTLEQALGKPPPRGEKRTELEVHDVDREYAIAYLRAILPSVNEFCSKLVPPLPQQVLLDDVSMGESAVALRFGRVQVSLGLRSGFKVVLFAGHVWAVHAPDSYETSPWWREEVRQSKEYLEPTRFSGRDATEKVRRLLLDRLALDEKTLFLDLDPVFDLRANATATNGIRRFVFHWQRAESDEQRTERQRRQELPEMSVSAEVDAVSGDIKAINFFHPSLNRPDPKVDQPMHSDKPKEASSGTEIEAK
jgi:hypothetical protein